MKSFHIPTRALLIASLLGAMLIGTQTIGQTAANADLPNCKQITQAERTAGIQCTADGDGGSTNNVDYNWVVIYNSGVKCMFDPNNGNPKVPSFIGTIQNIHTGEIHTNYCVAQEGNGGTDLKGLVKQKLKAPKPDPDFKANFLTGAPIHFTSPAIKDYTLDVPNFPGVVLLITTTDVTWNFGDGTTSKDLEPTHVYESITPDQQKKDQHSVHVTLTATWQATMMDPATGETEDLGTLTDTGAIDRLIVQVWSKQTEPNS
jgi:hypothetical protein